MYKRQLTWSSKRTMDLYWQCTSRTGLMMPDASMALYLSLIHIFYNALKYGASGYLLKGVSMDELANAITTCLLYTSRCV